MLGYGPPQCLKFAPLYFKYYPKKIGRVSKKGLNFEMSGIYEFHCKKCVTKYSFKGIERKVNIVTKTKTSTSFDMRSLKFFQAYNNRR